MKAVRKIFIAGLVIMLPILITIYVLGFTFRLIDSLLGETLRFYLGRSIPGLGFIVTLAIVFGVGLVATNVFGNRIIESLASAFARLPIVRPIYSAARQIIDAFSARRQNLFESVVMIEYPRKGVFSLAFITVAAAAEVQAKTRDDVVTVFLPTTPNPTSGFLLMVSRDELTPMQMSVEEALKLIISGGIVAPPWPPANNEAAT